MILLFVKDKQGDVIWTMWYKNNSLACIHLGKSAGAFPEPCQRLQRTGTCARGEWRLKVPPLPIKMTAWQEEMWARNCSRKKARRCFSSFFLRTVNTTLSDTSRGQVSSGQLLQLFNVVMKSLRGALRSQCGPGMTNCEFQLSVWIIKKQTKLAVSINKPQPDSYKGNIFIASQRYQRVHSRKRWEGKWGWPGLEPMTFYSRRLSISLSCKRLFIEAVKWMMQSSCSDSFCRFQPVTFESSYHFVFTTEVRDDL